MKDRLYILLLVLGALLWSCNGDEPSPSEARRTVLIYMLADNSLGASGYDANDLDEMKVAAVSEGLNGCRVMVYHHPKNSAPSLKELSSGGNFDVVKEYAYDDESFSTDPARLAEVVADCKRVAPAGEYGLILWSHGNGWVETKGARVAGKKKAFGQDRTSYMKVTSLASALEGKGFDWIYFDCCHMATVEVMYEMRHCAPVIAGSVAELPADGTDYTVNLPVFTADVASMVEAASNTFKIYDSKQGLHRTCTMSVVNTTALDRLAEVTGEVMELGQQPPHRAASQAFMLQGCTIYDLGEYVENITAGYPELYSRWLGAMDDVMMYREATPYIWNRIAIRHYSGLGCYILEDGDEASYQGYDNSAWWRDVVSRNPLYQ